MLQPLMAILLGFRDGRRDAFAGRAPFVLSLFHSQDCRQLAQGALHQIAVPLVVAAVLDLVLQSVILGTVSFARAIVTGAVLIAAPYSASRGLSNRGVRRLRARRA